MVTYILGGIAVAACMTWGMYRYQAVKRKKRIAKIKDHRAKVSPYKCVMIKTGFYPCNAAKNLTKTALLLDEAPALPLPICNAKQCDCRFLRYDDRRIHHRRSGIRGERTVFNEHENQRSNSDRRKNSHTRVSNFGL
jgi:hypothetical protein